MNINKKDSRINGYKLISKLKIIEELLQEKKECEEEYVNGQKIAIQKAIKEVVVLIYEDVNKRRSK